MWGWVLLPGAVALAYCAAGGFDLRLAVMGLVQERFGWGAVEWLIYPGLWAYQPSLTGVVCGPVTLIAVVLALHLSPRAWGRWAWLAVGVWLAVNPWVCWEAQRLLPRAMAVCVGWTPRGAGVELAVTVAQLGAFCVFAWWVLRLPYGGGVRAGRWAGALFAVGVTAATVAWVSDRVVNMTSGAGGLSRAGYVALGVGWHAAVFVVMVGGAVVNRRRAVGEGWRCEGCGYDLRGLGVGAPGAAAAVCPECGSGGM